jgi:hypothetical protein
MQHHHTARTAPLSLDSGVGDRVTVSFAVSRCRCGIFVERHVERAGEGLVLHAMRFADETAFLSWCLSDQLQFHFPLVYSNLRRTGCALFCEPS